MGSRSEGSLIGANQPEVVVKTASQNSNCILREAVPVQIPLRRVVPKLLNGRRILLVEETIWSARSSATSCRTRVPSCSDQLQTFNPRSRRWRAQYRTRLTRQW